MATVNRITKAPYRVNFYKHTDTDQLCGELLAQGKSNYYVKKKTGLSDSQISYRVRVLRDYGVSRMATRDGKGEFAQILEAKARNEIHRQFIRQLNRGPRPR